MRARMPYAHTGDGSGIRRVARARHNGAAKRRAVHLQLWLHVCWPRTDGDDDDGTMVTVAASAVSAGFGGIATAVWQRCGDDDDDDDADANDDRWWRYC